MMAFLIPASPLATILYFLGGFFLMNIFSEPQQVGLGLQDCYRIGNAAQGGGVFLSPWRSWTDWEDNQGRKAVV